MVKRKKKITYKDSGVDIEKANKLISEIKSVVNTTRVKGSMDSIGGFGGFFDPAKAGNKNPLLIASTDGVGTKLKIAQLIGKHDTIGIDLVAMCVNDILCSGAQPLFFLDYYATGKLNKKVWKDVIKGIVTGCRQSECALLGGETAEMPGMYKFGEYDLAGFSVGSVDRKNVIDGKNVKEKDVILGIVSSGLHSNGYSLVRKIFSNKEIKENANIILKPTTIYVKPILHLINKLKAKAIANITGGGFYDNIPRVLSKTKKAIIYENSWPMQKIYKIILKKANVDKKELYRTFNMGIGMVMVLSKKDAEKAKKILKNKFKLGSWIIGEIAKGKQGVEIV